ncbi:VOC family protein [Agromyces sp. NPDC058484]|uniref:VOC family protein n=1 Tax=Agromyces sp. NPDC058484 TaxID=3346524 RepID=UPI0036657D73
MIGPNNGAFIWHELMSRDPDTSQRFYQEVAGLSVQTLGPEAGGYRLLIVDGRPIGGMTGPRPDSDRWPSGGPDGHWVAYFASNDVDGGAARTEALGGVVLVGPIDVPGTGRVAVLRDPDGATFGLFAPSATA